MVVVVMTFCPGILPYVLFTTGGVVLTITLVASAACLFQVFSHFGSSLDVDEFHDGLYWNICSALPSERGQLEFNPTPPKSWTSKQPKKATFSPGHLVQVHKSVWQFSQPQHWAAAIKLINNWYKISSITIWWWRMGWLATTVISWGGKIRSCSL